ncbi:MAG TPA: hypothetical protein VGF21_05790 [Thermoleophilaceae bacterium]|jgi:hypothetical protein
MPFPKIAQPLPRAGDAHASGEKWDGWILAARGHGPEWARVFRAGLDDRERIWSAIAAAIIDAPVTAIRDRPPHGVVCGVEVTVTINDRTAPIATSWHYPDEQAAPRLVTAYPSA